MYQIISSRRITALCLTLTPLVLTTPSATLAHGVKQKGIEIVHPWAPENPTATEAIVSMIVRNRTGKADTLVSASTARAAGTTIEGSAAVPLTRSPLAPSALAKPGEAADITLRLRLTGLVKPLHQYDTFPMTLVFKRAGRIDIEVLVDEATATEPTHKH